MTDANAFRAVIPPILPGVSRPTWSVLIPTYNCARFLEETLNSVLIQDPGPARMEIIVVDDHSTHDDPYDTVQRIGRGRVQFVRQKHNVGKVRNFETGLLISRGQLSHQLHGDDRIGAGFYNAMECAFNAHPEAGAFFTESNYIDENGMAFGRTGRELEATGLLDEWLDRIVVEQLIQAPSMVLRRSVYESLGGFDRRLDMVEDWEMWIRVASRFDVGFVAESMADYRVASGSTTDASIRDGSIFRHLQNLMEVVDEYVPEETRQRLFHRRRANLSDYLLQMIPSLIAKKRFATVGRITLEAFRYRPSPQTAYRALTFSLRAGRSAR